MTAEQKVLVDMRMTNTIKDSDHMEYTVPVDGTKFIIDKYDAMYSSVGTRYLITTKVVNNLGTTLTEFRMNESDLLAILDCIDQFMTCMSYDDEMPIYTNPSQGDMCNTMIKLTRKNIDPDYYEYQPDYDNGDMVFPDYKFNIASKPDCIPEYLVDNKHGDFRNILFEIYQYSPYYQNMVPVYNVNMSDSELHGLTFDYFFCGLMDIPLNEFQEDLIMRMYNNGTI